MLVVLGLLIVISFYIFLKSIRIVVNGQVLVVERFGKVRTISKPGLTFIMPFADKVRAVVSLNDQTLKYKAENVSTRDRKKVNVDVSIVYIIEDPIKAVYEINDLNKGLEYIINTTLIAETSTFLYNDLYLQRGTLLERIKEQLVAAEDGWGIKVKEVNILDINLILK